jgi:hypothetical protein
MWKWSGSRRRHVAVLLARPKAPGTQARHVRHAAALGWQRNSHWIVRLKAPTRP